METTPGTGVIIPSSPLDRQKIKTKLTEAVNCMERIAGEKSQMKSIYEAIEAEHDLPKKVASKLARTMFKQNYANILAEQADFESLYEIVVEGAKAIEK